MQRRARFLWLVGMVSLVGVGLVFGGVPGPASAGQPITPAPSIEVQDAFIPDHRTVHKPASMHALASY